LGFIARREGHVLLLGPSGSGKELAAQAIHAQSDRAGRKLVARNAATFPMGLIDAELFGNAANYPNAGMTERPGLVGEADARRSFSTRSASCGRTCRRTCSACSTRAANTSASVIRSDSNRTFGSSRRRTETSA
jgi:hypothetical protein